MNIDEATIKAFETKLSGIHDHAIAARDESAVAISKVRQLREWLTQVQTEAMKAELAQRVRD